ncbi:hypothetical protein JGS22_004885 [Streptomyces sp. P38-E01]|uniref:Uncharacterized protein n=1 Tax=Streptomyces tardus TaxID=2780544 RepID=A0A949N3L6_9ACTN|nr:hypothetical protein [Streptomyces tardus]MBU7596989.1 hypothetical protein [Streptomyces tardus]
MAEGLERSYPVYRKLGPASVGYERLGHELLSEAVVLVRVRRLFHAGDGELMTDSFASYVLRRDEEGLRAHLCVPADDIEKLQALADRKGVDLFE